MGSRSGDKIKVAIWNLVSILGIAAWLLMSLVQAGAETTDQKQGRKRKNYEEDAIIVKFRPTVLKEMKGKIHDRLGSEKIKEFQSLRIHHAKLKKGISVEEAIAIYQADPDVEYAEPNYLLTIQTFPDDLYFNDLWGLYNIGQRGGTPGADIDAIRAWEITTGSENVLVAVIDTGMDYNHPDLIGNIWVNVAESNGSPGIDDDHNGYIDDLYGVNTYDSTSDPMDDHGHGTHVAGTIGAVGNNGMGVVGLNWHIKIIPCKFLNNEGFGYTDGALECLEYIKTLKDRGINIVATNNSWGGDEYSQALHDAIDAQRKSGILFIAAAGNDSRDNDQYDFYPASYYLPNLLSVAATDQSDSKAWFSNYGKRSVHVGAPGADIVSLRANETDMYGDGHHFIPPGDPGAMYYRASGTSMAVPHVTGLAALIKSQASDRSWMDIKNLILSGGENIGFYGSNIAGRINSYGSLTCTNSFVFSALEYPASFQAGIPNTLSALSINCGSPLGPVAVTTSSGEVIHLNDDGISPDLAAGDGIFSTSWTPSFEFSSLTFSSPAGTETVPPPSILTNSLPSAFINAYYRQILEVSDGVPPYIWSIRSGSLPEGLNLNSSAGEISGDPSKTGTWSFIIKVTDSRNAVAMKAFSMIVKDVDLIVTSVAGPSNASLGQQISITTTVKNQGSGEESGFYVSVYLCSGSVVDPDGLALTTSYVSPLAAGTERTLVTKATIPVTVAPGSYSIGAIVDTGNRVAESKETNNSLVGNPITIISEVDLVITSVSVPSTGGPGQQIAVTATVKNQGSSNSDAFYVTAYLSPDSSITAGGIDIGSAFVSYLAAGAQQTVTINATIPSTLTGNYYIGAIADSRSMVAESHESNNSLGGSFISITPADLVMTSVSGPTNANAGQQIGVTIAVRNQGNGGSGGFSLTAYLSSDPTITAWDDDLGMGDIEIGQIYVTGLASGTEQVVTVHATLPVALTGVYYFGAIVDGGKNVPESNENNNSLPGNQIVVAGGCADLIITSMSGPANANAGQKIAVMTTAKNQGDCGSAGFYLTVYLSTDTTITASDHAIGSVYAGSLPAGGQQGVSVNATLPSIFGGTYYLGAIADSSNAVAELSESNNSFLGNQVRISGGGPDLVITSVSGPGTATAGRQIAVTVTVKNQGNSNSSSSYISLHLSPEAQLTADALQIGSGYCSSISIGSEKIRTIYGTIPAHLTGTYYIGAIADSNKVVTESNENNNSLIGNQISVAR